MAASALAAADGIVFGGTADRRFFALDPDNGDVLWETRLNGDISGAPVTFEIDGRQYLAVGAGGRIGQATSYARLTDITLPQGSGVVWVFALPEREQKPSRCAALVSLAEVREQALANRKLARSGGNPLADKALRQPLRRQRVAAVVHGFRSSFRDWAEETDHPRQVVEAALAHVVRNPVEAAHARSDLFERRRRLMTDWAAYLADTQQSASSDRGTSGTRTHRNRSTLTPAEFDPILPPPIDHTAPQTSQAETRSRTDIKRSTDRAGRDIERDRRTRRSRRATKKIRAMKRVTVERPIKRTPTSDPETTTGLLPNKLVGRTQPTQCPHIGLARGCCGRRPLRRSRRGARPTGFWHTDACVR